jgi:hypothetical protein
MFEFLFALTWLGWAVFGILTIFLIALVDHDEWPWTTVCFILFLGALWYFVPAVAILITDPMLLMWYALIYVGIGVIWSFIKWLLFVYHEKEHKRPMPKAKDNKSEIVGWMVYWPWSAFWTILNDPIRRFYKMLVRLLEKMYDKIAEAVYY